MASRIKQYFNLLKDAGSEFSDDNATKLSASLAYYTLFSIGPLLLVLITLMSLFYKKAAVNAEVAGQLKNLVGKDGADALLAILANIGKQSNTTLFGIIGIIVLVFGATGVFTEIQSSINYIWSIRAKPQRSWLKFIIDRFVSFSLIIGMGFVMLVTLFINLLLDLLTDRLQHFLGNANIILVKGLNVTILFIVISFLFGVIYKVLPDGKIHWKDAAVGATFTGFMFLIGKFLIGYYLGSTKLSTTYGGAASIIILLSWVYYSSLILYFGAEFTKVYAMKYGSGIIVYDTAVFVLKSEAKELPNKKLPTEADVMPNRDKAMS